MPLYEADGTSKQKPIVRDGTGFYSHATCPTHSTKQKRPTYVVVNEPGTYMFSYENTPTNYVTGSVVASNGGPIRLDINPTAWKDATTGTGVVGDVTFVYVRVS